MEIKALLTADYLDILFDKRNKKYGGYELRKHYDRRLGKAALLLFASIAALSCISFINVHKEVTAVPFTRVITTANIEVPLLPKPVPQVIPPEPPPAVKVKTHIFTDPVITNDVIPDDKHMTQNKDLVNTQVGTADAGADSTDPGIIPSKITGKGDKPDVVAVVKPAEPMVYVEQMPQFSGDLTNYISAHIHYPESARSAGIEGTVMVRFVVNEDGSVSSATAMRSIGGGCDEEALRMVSGMPKWKPGRQNGTAVKVYFTLPIKFVLN